MKSNINLHEQIQVPPLRIIIATNIRLLRLNQGLSQEALAELCGFHRTYVGSVERGERNITISTLEAFATALSVAPSELLVKNE